MKMPNAKPHNLPELTLPSEPVVLRVPVPGAFGPLKPAVPSSPSMPTGYDPFSRPTNMVTVEEWRIMICSIAGPLRIVQGNTRVLQMPTGRPVLLAQNDKSYALFVQGLVADDNSIFLGPTNSVNGATGLESGSLLGGNGSFQQVLLPSERLYGIFTGVGTTSVKVTEVTV